MGIARKNGRRTCTLLLACIVFITSWQAAQAQRSELHLVSTVWPPFTNAAGMPRFALDLVDEALKRVNLSSATAIVDAPKFTSSLLEGPFDGSAAAWKDAEREKLLLFSQPYLENRLILVGRKGSDVSAKTLAALKGKRIAIVEGYSYGDSVESSGPTFVRSKGEEDSLKLLLTSGVDYTLMDDLVVEYIADHYPEEARTRLQIGTTPLVTRELYFCVRRSLPDAKSIVDRFNAQLRAMIADRTYHRLLHVDWIRADVDGDGVTEYVAKSDNSGPNEPQHAYSLFTPKVTAPQEPKPGFYFGGNIYSSWAAVPQQFKGYDEQHPDPARSTASIFTFSW